MILADSNLLIYAIAQNAALVDWFAENKPAVSAVSLVEVLGYHKLNSADKSALEALFSELTIIYPSADVFQTAVPLLRQHPQTEVIYPPCCNCLTPTSEKHGRSPP